MIAIIGILGLISIAIVRTPLAAVNSTTNLNSTSEASQTIGPIVSITSAAVGALAGVLVPRPSKQTP